MSKKPHIEMNIPREFLINYWREQFANLENESQQPETPPCFSQIEDFDEIRIDASALIDFRTCTAWHGPVFVALTVWGRGVSFVKKDEKGPANEP